MLWWSTLENWSTAYTEANISCDLCHAAAAGPWRAGASLPRTSRKAAYRGDFFCRDMRRLYIDI